MRMVSGYRLNGMLNYGSMIGVYDREMIAIVPFWREKRDDLFKHITKQNGIFVDWK